MSELFIISVAYIGVGLLIALTTMLILKQCSSADDDDINIATGFTIIAWPLVIIILIGFGLIKLMNKATDNLLGRN